MNAKNKITNFSKISDSKDLINYLDDYNTRLGNNPSLFHYTTIDNALKIIEGKTWHLSNAKYMNDKL